MSDWLLNSGLETREKISQLRKERADKLNHPTVVPLRDAVAALPTFKSKHQILDQAVVEVGSLEELSHSAQSALQQALQIFKPWKKGPFRLFENSIDAEWRSDWKWQRIQAHKESLEGRRVADIGCHNGYFMFRMAAENPDLVIGFEPYAKHYYNFELIQRFVQHPALAYELLGVEHIHLFPQFFDSVFCLGILYHHTDPVGLLRKIHSSLRKGGELIIDCQGIAGDQPLALTPAGRYARARGIWFLPTVSCLQHWIKRAGFSQLECFYSEPLSPEEQRRTRWAEVESLADFLDPITPQLTIEGYPAPWRHYIRAQR